jgi:actin-related protein
MSVIPIHDGYVLKKGIQYQPLGGDYLDEHILSFFKKQQALGKGQDIIPRYLVKSKQAVDSGKPASWEAYPHRRHETPSSYHQWALRKTASDFKETLCQLSETPFNPQNLSKRGMKNYEFPNGYNSAFKMERFLLPEVLFDPRFGKVIFERSD